MRPLNIIGSILGLLVVIGGLIFWHFKTVNGFKDEIHKLELKFKDLEHKDNLQQDALDKLSELYPLLKKVFDQMKGGRYE